MSGSTASTGSFVNAFSLNVYSDANFNHLVGTNPVFIGQRKAVKEFDESLNGNELWPGF